MKKLSEDRGSMIYKSYKVLHNINYKGKMSMLLLIFSQTIKCFVESLIIVGIWTIVVGVL